MTETPAIRLIGLTKKFPQLTAVNEIDLTIQPGEVVALLGPNGAGKSTTIDLALGLSLPTAGNATLFGSDPRDAIVTGRVGAMLQGGALLPTTTVRESIALIHALHRRPMPVDEAMERAGVTDIAKQKISSLSGGQMQRARFAVAVVSNPDLLILDEPTAAMDVGARHSFWDSMREFTSLGKTVVFATHYLDEADTFADRIVIMGAGRIVADGTPSEIKAVVSGRTLSFDISALAVDAAEAARFESLPGVTHYDRRGSRVSLRTDNSDETLRELLRNYPDANEIEIVSRNMDDAFMALTASTASTGSATETSSATAAAVAELVDGATTSERTAR